MSAVQYAICTEDYVIEEGNDRLELKRGHEYIVGDTLRDDNLVRVFDRFWAWVPVHLFRDRQPLDRKTGAR